MTKLRSLTREEYEAELALRLTAAARPVAARAPRRPEPRRDVALDLAPVREAQRAARKAATPSQRPAQPLRGVKGGRAGGVARAARAAAVVEAELPIGSAAANRAPEYRSGAAWLDDGRWSYVPPSVHANLRWQNFLLAILDKAPGVESVTVERPGLPAGHGRTWLRTAGGTTWMVVQLPPVSYDVATDDRITRHEMAHAVQEAALFTRDGAERYALEHDARTADAERFAESWEGTLRPDTPVADMMRAARRWR